MFPLTIGKSIGKLTDKALDSVRIEKVHAPKKIRDALTGTFILGQHEINILDLPFVQRLRRIGQTALASLTYPCTTHNRFQHTLGVTNIISRMVAAFRNKESHVKLLGDNDARELRLAALLHDVGHGPFSHATEEITEHLPEIRKECRKARFDRVHSKPHEIVSYYIVMSKGFHTVVERINNLYGLNIDVERTANMIIGNMKKHMREGYISDFLNGPFDADKLDYMPRDAYFSGLKMDVDLERIAHTCLVDLRGDSNPRRLACDISGAHNLEQILFNKVLLHSSMYHHHKVRAAVCMIKSVFEIIKDFQRTPLELSFDKIEDFLSVDDYDILSSFRTEPLLKELVDNIRNRRLLKRACVISRKTVETRNQFQRINRLMEDPAKIRILRQLIVDEMKKMGCQCSLYDLWLDLPKPPSLNEPSLCKVRVAEKEYIDLAEVFPADWWLTAYNETKWKGHIFCPPIRKVRDQAYEASERVLKSVEGIQLLPMAREQAKIY